MNAALSHKRIGMQQHLGTVQVSCCPAGMISRTPPPAVSTELSLCPALALQQAAPVCSVIHSACPEVQVLHPHCAVKCVFCSLSTPRGGGRNELVHEGNGLQQGEKTKGQPSLLT